MNLHHIGINVRNLEESKQFYQTYFGFREELYLEMKDETILFLVKDTLRLELIHDSVIGESRSLKAHFAMEVEDLGEWIDFLKKQKIMPIEGPIDIDNRWKVVFFLGPDGELIELVET
ncbi:VOC family protein [Rossellomorea aquimaris]|uniref:VOC family protein n=1 Tax=Rossellomorea aquimaris TaxID=189382 RepID=UPI0007D09259|nr:VOC family protein [Rossellomorea aquimaris]